MTLVDFYFVAKEHEGTEISYDNTVEFYDSFNEIPVKLLDMNIREISIRDCVSYKIVLER